MSRPSMRARLLGLCLGALCAVFTPAIADDAMAFWDTPQRGANSFNKAPPDAAYFEALAATGATWVRLTHSKWAGAGRDFLLGSADQYEKIPEADLALLTDVLDRAHAAGLKVVLFPLSLPGARWTQHGGGFDDRLWSEPRYWDEAARFWADLAAALADHPAIAAYNILNEPAPERLAGLAENAPTADTEAFLQQMAGTPRDLPGFYEHVIAAIRTVDPETPIMVEGGYYANPRNLAAWPGPLSDERVLYAFHIYEPYDATSPSNMRREAPLRYPGVETRYDGRMVTWEAATVAAHIDHAFDWADRQGIPASRIVAAEFGCMRRWPDCGTYMTDVIDAVDAHGGHWAFYAFREDEWDGMDYELPQSLPPGRFYWLTDTGKADQLPRDGALMDLLKARMAP